MAERPRILIAGGYGVFGRLLARELLATTSARVVVAGRDYGRAAAACRALGYGDRAEPVALDLSDSGALARAATGCVAVACTAGPFQTLPRCLPAASVRAGAHWLDIGDDPAWVLPLLADGALDATAAAAGLAVMPGLSSVPALSGALVRWCREREPAARRARVTLFIGNRNAKGAAAIASALGADLADPRPVDLPVGRRAAYRFDSPDAALLRVELGLAVEFRVAFEWGVATWLMAALGRLGREWGPGGRMRLARWLAAMSGPVSRFGSDVGYLKAEVWDGGGGASAALLGAGQRLAVLPCALAVESLLSGELKRRGLVHPACWLGPDEWVKRLRARGIQFVSNH
jgi:hypothetical protein